MNFGMVKTFAIGLKDFTLRNSPTILTAIGVVGTVTTAVLAARGAIKANDILEEEEDIALSKWLATGEHESSMPVRIREQPKEVIKLTWQCYIPAVATGLLTITAIVGANRISLRRQAAIASLYAVAERAAKEYEQKVVETLGERKAEEIKHEIAEEHVRKNPVSETVVHHTGRGETLMFDGMSGRYFRSDLEYVRKIVNDFNKEILSHGFKSLNEFYDEIHLEHVDLGELIGWGSDYGFLEIRYRPVIEEITGEPCIALEYKVEKAQY